MNTSILVTHSRVHQRLPAGELERLKKEVSIERLAEARGIQFEHRGQDLHGLLLATLGTESIEERE